MIDLEQRPDGIMLAVRVQPGARREGVVGEHNGAIKIAVHTAPEQGKANRAVVEVLANALGISRGDVGLLSGETSRQKRFLVRNLELGELAARIESIIKKV